MRFVLQSDRGRYYAGPDPNDYGDPCLYTDNIMKAVIFSIEVLDSSATFAPELPPGKWNVVSVTVIPAPA